jgi:hypothetical protein
MSPEEAAKSFLAIKFDKSAQDRMDALAEKAREGSLTAAEEVEIEAYERAGHLLGIAQSKARIFLRGKPDSES